METNLDEIEPLCSPTPIITRQASATEIVLNEDSSYTGCIDTAEEAVAASEANRCLSTSTASMIADRCDEDEFNIVAAVNDTNEDSIDYDDDNLVEIAGNGGNDELIEGIIYCYSHLLFRRRRRSFIFSFSEAYNLSPVEEIFIEEASISIKVEQNYEPFDDESGALNAFFEDNQEIDLLGAAMPNQQEIIVDDDVTILIENNVFPIPFQESSTDFHKRKDDWFSGNLPFNDVVSIQIV